jgi:hypothetical protein
MKCPSNCAINLDTLDLILWHHFTTSTNLSLSTEPNIQKIWGTVVPEMAWANPYLLRGLLACSAMHLAYLQPSRQQELTVRAVSHQDRALPIFRSAISSVNALSCHTVYAFSRLLVIFAFASHQNVERLILAQKGPYSDVSICFHLIRGGCSMLYSVKHLINTGPLKWLIPPEEEIDNYAYYEDSRLTSLSSLLSLEPDIAWQGDASVVYLDALSELRVSFVKAYIRGTSFNIWDVVKIWPSRVSDSFVVLLSNEHPGALVLLAYYCILLKRLESYWYMRGYSARLLTQIYTRLGPKWHIWIAWPLQDVGIYH